METKNTEDFFIRTLLNRLQLKDIMIKKVIAIDVEEPFSRVEELLRENHIRHLPIINEAKKLVGIITIWDLYRISTPRKDEEGNLVYDKETLDGYILKHVMTKDPFALGPEDTVAQALLTMVDKGYGSIVVVDKSKTLLGIITQIDILKIAANMLREGEIKK